MIEQNKAVEQLWYTWSDVGLDTIRAGFRIRAASEGLKDIRSARVQHLDRYQRYSLPRNVNPAMINLNTAPICLSLINTGQERILVHKVYTGKDAVGRYGAFFVHLLTDLPEGFSAFHAISLWKRPNFWKDSDQTLKDRRSTSLDRIPPEDLMQKSTYLNRKKTASVQKYFQYIIQAYLTKKPLPEKKTGQLVPQKIYIAAPDDDIAQLILGLTSCLPPQLLKGLTFSTYEHDITQATTEIIGTCWLSTPEAEQDPHVGHLLPAQYYQEKLAINCYTGDHSLLENNPLVENKPLVAQFAQLALRYFVQQGGTKKFEAFLNRARDIPDLDVDQFLKLFETMILRALNPSKCDIESLLTPRSNSDYQFTIDNLSEPIYPEALIDLAIREPQWWQTFGKEKVTNLRASAGAFVGSLLTLRKSMLLPRQSLSSMEMFLGRELKQEKLCLTRKLRSTLLST